jgi:putative salt-induced outer membrane protein YdiY
MLIIAVCLVWMAAPLAADEAYLVNGDRITGKIKTLLNDKLTMESDMAGTLTIDINNVATFKTDEPAEVLLKDGTGFKQLLKKAEAGKFAIESSGTLKAQDFDIAAVSSINPPPKPVPKWHGDISGAIVSTHGNTNVDTQNISINLHKRTENDRTLLSTDYIRGKQKNPDTGVKEITQDEWKMRGKYDYFFTKKLFGFLEGRYERDRIAELDRRVVVGTGVGYQWVESEPFNFSTEAGIASVYEKYDNQTDSDSQVSAQLGYHLDKKFNETFMFINDLTYYPGLEKFSDYLLTTTAEIRAKITEQFFTNFKVVFDYDSTPAQGAGNTDVKYILGVGVKF